MKIGMIGAGRVGCSIGKYLTDNGKTVIGFYSRTYENAAEAAEFTGTDCFHKMEELVALSDTLFITTPDGQIGAVWERMKEMSVNERIVCHFSGSLSSDVFTGIDERKAYGASIHPMLAFRDRFTSYRQLQNCFFTLEGHSYALRRLEELLRELGNPYCQTEAAQKAKYHCAASVLSNDVLALLDMGFGLLVQCGFTEKEALQASKALISGNVENVLENGTLPSMTGPILRGDVSTVKKHLDVLEGEEREIHRLLGKRLLGMAWRKQEMEAAERKQTDSAVSEQLCMNYREISDLLS
ncbi:MAG: DUF2520 domain-containing protein [Lachnospiraceae bacterium]|nr:DUF2520 domain-containing protein [Lachnospiraceae bacterium]